VEVVWPRTCAGRAQINPKWAICCETKLDLIKEIESWVLKHSARCEQHLIKLGYYCPGEPFPIMPHGHQQPAHSHAHTTQCLNLHALGEQWIEEVTDVDIVQTPPEECLEGEHLKFKAHIRGWKTRTRKELYQNLLGKADHNLWQALLRPLWKDVLLIPRDWYPEHQPRYETKGWWYVPVEEVLERACKSCNAFCEIEDFVGAKRRREVSVRCYKCQLEEDSRTNTSRGQEQKKDASCKRDEVTLEGCTLRNSERVKGQERVDYHEHSWERDIQNDRGYSERIEQLSYGLKMRASDPRYITTGDDSNRGDVLLTMAQVRELITKKDQSEEGIATVWLTTTEMGFSLTDEPNAIECTKDVRDGRVSDRYLAPAISRFAIEILANVATEADMDQ
jgi:hypothetical protein